MSTQTVPRDDTVTGLDVIEGIDLDAEVPCEFPNEGHGEHPADIRVRRFHTCGAAGTRFICWGAWHEYGHLGVRCLDCRECGIPRGDFFRIVEVLR